MYASDNSDQMYESAHQHFQDRLTSPRAIAPGGKGSTFAWYLESPCATVGDNVATRTKHVPFELGISAGMFTLIARTLPLNTIDSRGTQTILFSSISSCDCKLFLPDSVGKESVVNGTLIPRITARSGHRKRISRTSGIAKIVKRSKSICHPDEFETFAKSVIGGSQFSDNKGLIDGECVEVSDGGSRE